MRTRPDHREAVARRLELLRAELEPGPVPEPPSEPPLPRYLELVPDGPEPEPTPPVTQETGRLPVPGRHAARRSRMAAWLPDTVRGRVAIAPWHLTVVALLVAAGLAVTCWLVVRADARIDAPSVPQPVGSTSPLVALTAAPSGVAASAPAASPSVTVDVAGKVRTPGVRVLPAGSRVIDAVRAAGGPRPGVDLTGLNQARVLVDGEQIVVGGPPGAVATGPSAGAAGGGLVNLNSASVEQLEGLPEIGPVTAQAILDWRTAHGGFGAVDELLEVDGIGEKTLERLLPLVTV
ncbi:MAG TPA: ComEA family DNA-binding protein [Nocardioides sp.]|uniref:ComEA family DNA-binding protein n=1 Tax=Nocardioides sp. TaxID=35761 RepID=UPI002EDAF6D4